jgi:hypothetical protein
VERKIKSFQSSRSSEQNNNRLFAAINPMAKVITMGDLNDGPYNKSVKIALGAKAIKTDVLRSGFIIPLRK